MSMISKAKTLLWYLIRPKYYKQLARLITAQFAQNKKESTREQAELWCNKFAIGTEDLLGQLGIDYKGKLEKIFLADFKEANKKIELLPVKMGGGGNMELLYYLCENIKATKVVETGVAHGWSSLSLLLSLKKRNKAKLISTDMPYAKMGNEDFVGCVVSDRLKDHWQLIRLPDINGLPLALKEFDEIDLCHYDSDKSYSGRMWAYPKLWKKMKKGGYFISDDIGDNIGFKEFVEAIKKPFHVVKMGSQYIGLIIK